MNARVRARASGAGSGLSSLSHASATKASERGAEGLSEQLGEEFVETVTSAQDEGEGVFNQVVPEEAGGPFVETSGNTEYAYGTDASNIAGATREPFPKT